MSLNWNEIDRVLGELDLVGAQLQRIVQPSYDTLLLSFYKPGKATELMICVAHGACRLHATKLALPKPPKPQRFTELLRAQVRGARVEAIEQLGAERIVRLRIGRDEGERILYARLWSGAANVILTKPDGTIVDVLTRKPSKGEIAGGRYAPEAGPAPDKPFPPRDFPGEGGYNERVDAYYAEHGSELSRQALIERAKKYFASKRASIELRVASLEKALAAYAEPERLKELGDILMANPAGPIERCCVRADDFYRGGSVIIHVDEKKSVVENAKEYYEKARKARSGLADAKEELAEARAALAELAAEERAIEAEENPYRIRAYLAKRRTAPAEAPKRYPGLSLELDGWLILVGRSAAENDQLLRRHVRGNDLWMHARDYSGSYVFIRARAGKSFPLEIMLAAGNLALYYSKGRSAGAGDLYYTHVKYLRRAKDGPKGLVLPTQEKNLRVKLDEDRLRALKRLIGRED